MRVASKWVNALKRCYTKILNTSTNVRTNMRFISLRTDKKWITKWSEAGPQRLVVEENVSDRKRSDKLLLLNYYVPLIGRGVPSTTQQIISTMFIEE